MSRREAALVVALAVVTTGVLTYPLAFQLGTGGRVDAEDGLFSIWNVAWVARTAVADPTALFHANIFYPHRTALAFSEANLVAGLIAVPPYWRTRNPYAAHNTVVLLSFMLALVGTYLLVRRLTGSRSADWRAYLASPARAHRWLLDRIEVWNEVLFPGFLTLGLAGIGVASARLSAQTGRRHSSALSGPARRTGRVVALYVLIGLLAWWASLGPSSGLYTALFEVVPGFGMLRAPARLGIVVALVLAVLAGLGVAWLARGPRAPWVTTGLILVALVELAAVPYPHYDAPRFPAAYQALARLPAGPVAEFPYFNDRIDYPRHSYYMVGSTTHWHPLVNGYSDLIPRDFRDEVDDLAAFPSRRALEILDQHQTRYVLLHRRLYNDEDWAAVVSRLDGFHAHLTPIFWDADGWLFEIVH